MFEAIIIAMIAIANEAIAIVNSAPVVFAALILAVTLTVIVVEYKMGKDQA